MSAGLSRRRLFSLFGRPLRGPANGARPPDAAPPGERDSQVQPAPRDRVAVIQGRFCLAYTSFCSVCVERCPVPGAMTAEKGIPRVLPTACTGCGICHDICPAPTNAVLVIPRRKVPRDAAPPTPSPP